MIKISTAKLFLSVFLLTSLAACGSSGDSNSDNGPGSTIEDDPTTGDDPITGDDPTTGDDPDATSTSEPIAETVALALPQLLSASVTDTEELTRLIFLINELEEDSIFTDQNQLLAQELAATASQANNMFDKAELLNVLELQIIAGVSPLVPLSLTDGAFNRIHNCPDGGMLFATKNNELENIANSGFYIFEECNIGEIYIDGSYRQTEEMTSLNTNFLRITMRFSDLTIRGSDDITTTLEGSILQDVTLSIDDNGSDFVSTESGASANQSIESLDGKYIFIKNSDFSTDIAYVENPIFQDSSMTTEARTVNLGVSVSALAIRNQGVVLGQNQNEVFQKTRDAQYFETGQLNLTFLTPSNQLVVQADNGDLETYDRFIVDPGGTTSAVESWDSSVLQTVGPSRRLRFFRR